MNTSLKNILKVLKVLYIDVQEDVPKSIQNTLKLFFKDVYYTQSFEDAIFIYNDKHPDIIISEVSINGDKSFLPLLQNIRKYNHLIPIIVTSSHKEENIIFDAIRLQLIDFLVKPLTLDNFIYPLNNAAKHILHHGNVIVLIAKDIKYNYIDKNIKIKTKIIKLTKNESRLIELLLANEGKILANTEIEFHIWGEEYVSDSAFKSLFKRLRDKIGNDIIHNSPGHGYYINSND